MLKKIINKLFWLFLLFVFAVSCTSDVKKSQQEFNLGEFGAFYTKVNSGEEFEKYSRTGELWQ